MATDTFPTGNMANALSVIYSKKLNAKFYQSTVLAAICNTAWEGEIQSEGSKVIIRTRPDVLVQDYDRATGVQYQDLEPPKVELPIDKTKYYAFVDDYIQTAQADIALVNLANAGGITQCMAGTKDFAGFASQFIKHESLTLESHFGVGHRGLQVYGYKVLKPEAGVLLPAKKA